jgi:hypothetical protein
MITIITTVTATQLRNAIGTTTIAIATTFASAIATANVQAR